MFEKGDVVTCLDAEQSDSCLTLYKEYTVLDIENSHNTPAITIIDVKMLLCMSKQPYLELNWIVVMAVKKVVKRFNLFTVLKKLKECVGFFFFNNLIATNVLQIGVVASQMFN